MKTFSEKVYELCLRVPRGNVTTYKKIAQQLGIKGYRAVGQALRCNPYAPQVPCHRVVRSDGSIGGFNGKRDGCEIVRKRELLRREGVEIVKGKIDLEKYLFVF